MADYSWIPVYSGQQLPANALFVGNDSNGDPIYVGRVFHDGDNIPCKVVPNKNCAFVAYDGCEITKTSYEVLCGHGFSWTPSSGGMIVPNGIIGGRTSSGESLYIGRTNYAGSNTPGKIHPSHGCMYIPYGGKEIRIDHYEALIVDPLPTWVACAPSQVLPNAIPGGHDADGQSIYVGRAFHAGEQLPAKVIPGKNAAYVSHNGEEILVHNVEVLCGHDYHWVGSAMGHVPPGAVMSGRTAEGEPLYIGRGHFEGSVTPGKVHPSHQCLYIPFGGSERRITQYEVLVKGY